MIGILLVTHGQIGTSLVAAATWFSSQLNANAGNASSAEMPQRWQAIRR